MEKKFIVKKEREAVGEKAKEKEKPKDKEVLVKKERRIEGKDAGKKKADAQKDDDTVSLQSYCGASVVTKSAFRKANPNCLSSSTNHLRKSGDARVLVLYISFQFWFLTVAMTHYRKSRTIWNQKQRSQERKVANRQCRQMKSK